VKISSDNNGQNLGRIVKQRRVLISLTLGELSARSGVSASHLGRIERGERFPSARILRRITRPLGFDEGELFTLAGYLSSWPLTEAETMAGGNSKQLNPIVASILRQGPYEVQHAVIVILSMLKSIAKQTERIGRND
jgi:transcriptional regulator with XRE-family HTH domain